jgi:ethanolamine permease
MSNPSLKKVLKPVHLWALGVGLVISGEYFGWNLGWGVAGTGGFLIATVLVTIFYITFIFSFTELTSAIPHAGGPFAYAYKALGPWGGLLAGYATLVEFLLAPPAVAFALGSYVHFLYPGLPVLGVAIGSYVVFTIINALGVKESAVFSLIVTLLAIAELLVFMGIVAPGFHYENLKRDAMPFGWSGVFAALPFAIWFYLAIEGMAMVAEEVEDPKRTIPKGYIYGMATLVILALGVMFFTGGVTDWHNLAHIDYPLPEAISVVLGKQNSWTKVFAGIGLFGLVASFHSVIISYSRQLYAMARSGYLPAIIARVNTRFRTPHVAMIVGGIVGIISLCTGTTGEVITLSALGAVVMYVISMISLLVLRRTQPDMERPYKVPFYPWIPWIALILGVVCMIAIIYYNQLLSAIFLGGLLLAALIFIPVKKKVLNLEF